MTKRGLGLLAALAVVTLTLAGSRALAQQESPSATAQQTPAQPSGAKQATREISGRVIEASQGKLFVDHMGAVVEFNIAPDAQFSGVKSGNELSPGQEVRASFTIEDKTTNVAKRISLAREAGSPSR